MVKTLSDVGVISSVDNAYLLAKRGSKIECYNAATLVKIGSFELDEESICIIYFEFPYALLYNLDNYQVCFINFDTKKLIEVDIKGASFSALGDKQTPSDMVLIIARDNAKEHVHSLNFGEARTEFIGTIDGLISKRLQSGLFAAVDTLDKNVWLFEDENRDLYSQSLDIYPRIKNEYLTQCCFSVGRTLYLSSENGLLISIDVNSKQENWVLEEVVGWKWDYNNDLNLIFSIYQNRLFVICPKAGKVVFSQDILFPWKDELIQPNLMHLTSTNTHVLCCFLGKGLSVIDRKTANFDFHWYDGETIGSCPVILNNRLYLKSEGGGDRVR